MRTAFIGGGNMATALIGGLTRSGQPGSLISVCDPHPEKLERLSQDFGVSTHDKAGPWLGQAEIVVLAVKPQKLKSCCLSLRDFLAPDPVILSIAAGVDSRVIRQWLFRPRVLRAMPNTAAGVGLAFTGLYVPPDAIDAAPLARRVLEGVGRVLEVTDEDELHLVTAGSGSGPAYFFYFLECFAAALRERGMSPERAAEMVLGTAEGALALARAPGADLTALRRVVTSPGGTTERAISSLQKDDLEGALSRAVTACQERSRELSAALSDD